MSLSRTRWKHGLLVSTVSAASLCTALPANAQAPAGSQQPAATQSTLKSAVQKEIEELYRKDGRELPEYMQNGTPASSAQAAPAATPRAPQLPKAQPAAQSATQPAASTGAPVAGTKSVRQQLAEYYASEGKSLPTVQRADAQSVIGSAEPALQQTAAAADTVSLDGKEEMAPAKKRRLIDRLNPFRRLAKEPAAPAPHKPAQATRTAPAGKRLEPALPQQDFASKRPAPPVSDEFEVPQAAPARQPRTIRLVPAEPLTLEPAPAAQPQTIPAPAATAASASPAPQPAAQPVTSPSTEEIFSLTDPPAAAPAAPKTQQVTQPASPAKQPAPAAKVPNDDFPNPFGADAEKQADAEQDPFTGLKLDDQPAKASQTPANPAALPPAPEAAPKAAAQAPAKAENEPNPFTVDEAAKPAPLPAADSTPTSRIDAAHEPAAPIQQAVPRRAEASREARASESKPAVTRKAASSAEADAAQSQMRKINERVGLSGFKGFCPVCLRDDRQLVDSQPRFTSIHNLKPYEFSSAAAKAAFERSPEKYSPAADGTDVVIKANSDQQVDGTLDYAVWYKDRLYLFSSPESLETFSLNPSQYAAK